jgi:hypothetical protein
VQSGRHPYIERGRDLYETPACATRALLRAEAERLPHRLWESAAGKLALADVLRAAGYDVTTSDIANYGLPLDFVADFLTTTKAPVGCQAVVTNPPYRLAEQFVAHALKLVPLVIMLCRLAFLESAKRAPILDGGQLSRISLFSSSVCR